MTTARISVTTELSWTTGAVKFTPAAWLARKLQYRPRTKCRTPAAESDANAGALKRLRLWCAPTDRKHRPAAQFLAGSLDDYGDPELQARKAPDGGAVLVYPMAPDPSKLPAEPQQRDIVLGIAWITPIHLHGAKRQLVQFKAKNSALADEPIVPAD